MLSVSINSYQIKEKYNTFTPGTVMNKSTLKYTQL